MKVVPLVLGVVGLVAGVWWWRRAPAPAPPPVSSAAPSPRSRAVEPAALRRPDPIDASAALAPAVVPETGAPPAGAVVSVPFAAEVRDPAWAVDQERELKLRLDRLGVELTRRGARASFTNAECRRSLCQIEIAATATADLSAVYGALETTEGLYGWADAIVLGQVDADAVDGSLTTHVLVQFDR